MVSWSARCRGRAIGRASPARSRTRRRGSTRRKQTAVARLRSRQEPPATAWNRCLPKADGNSLLAHGMQDVVGSSPTSSISRNPRKFRLSVSLRLRSERALSLSGHKTDTSSRARARGSPPRWTRADRRHPRRRHGHRRRRHGHAVTHLGGDSGYWQPPLVDELCEEVGTGRRPGAFRLGPSVSAQDSRAALADPESAPALIPRRASGAAGGSASPRSRRTPA